MRHYKKAVLVSFFLCLFLFSNTAHAVTSISETTTTSGGETVVNVNTSTQTNNTGIIESISQTIAAGSGDYVLLAPISNFFPGGRIDIKGTGLGSYLNGLYKAGIAIATGLALIMIVLGGLEYVSTDSIQGKSSGRDRIQNALIGLLLALASYLILQQINPNLLKSDLQVSNVTVSGGISGQNVSLVSDRNAPDPLDLANFPFTQGLVGGAFANSQYNLYGPLAGGGATQGGYVLSNSGVAARIVASARANLNTSTCFAVTENGRRGCGYAFGKIMNDAGIVFTNLSSTAVLSTSNIYSVLTSDRRFYLAATNNTNSALPGDIIISPTVGSNTGHVGIVELAGAARIISNSSGAGIISDYFTGSKWINYYNGKGLNTYIFRYR